MYAVLQVLAIAIEQIDVMVIAFVYLVHSLMSWVSYSNLINGLLVAITRALVC